MERFFLVFRRLFISKKAISIIAGIIIAGGCVTGISLLINNNTNKPNIEEINNADNELEKDDNATTTISNSDLDTEDTSSNTEQQEQEQQQEQQSQQNNTSSETQQSQNNSTSNNNEQKGNVVTSQTQAAKTQNTTPEQSQANNTLNVTPLNSSNGFNGDDSYGRPISSKVNSTYTGSASKQALILLNDIASGGLSVSDAKSKYVGKTVDGNHTVTNIEYYEVIITPNDTDSTNTNINNSGILNNQPNGGLYCQQAYAYKNSARQRKLARLILYLS